MTENFAPFLCHALLCGRIEVCAIIGGVFTTAGLVDDFFYRGLRKFVFKGQCAADRPIVFPTQYV